MTTLNWKDEFGIARARYAAILRRLGPTAEALEELKTMRDLLAIHGSQREDVQVKEWTLYVTGELANHGITEDE